MAERFFTRLLIDLLTLLSKLPAKVLIPLLAVGIAVVAILIFSGQPSQPAAAQAARRGAICFAAGTSRTSTTIRTTPRSTTS